LQQSNNHNHPHRTLQTPARFAAFPYHFSSIPASGKNCIPNPTSSSTIRLHARDKTLLFFLSFFLSFCLLTLDIFSVIFQTATYSHLARAHSPHRQSNVNYRRQLATLWSLVKQEQTLSRLAWAAIEIFLSLQQ
jgi:hypothetical protein